MRVIRVLPDSGWTGVDNQAARSRRISFRAKGLLLELLSYPPNNDITVAKLAGWSATAKREGYVAEGREAIQMAMRELEREGYVVHVRRRGQRGQWDTTTYVSAVPEALERVAPSTGFPHSVDQYSVEQHSADQQTASQSLSTHKTDEKTNKKTDGEEAGLEHSSALAGARAGQPAGRLVALYEAANQLDDGRLRRLLLQFERKRPRIYRKQRQKTLSQLGSEAPEDLHSVRAVDLLSYQYALQHYAREGKPLPDWLTRFPR
ncbi:hypothetical protein GTY83_07190 [Streptomyces sp. SID4928]|uniref:hypothetical protein n=1 Tax=unclassified Streptomyces TaxID=2593676 RepID=UPI0001C1C988|nr:hypothetical protein [Streptomyces sp. ACT-1]EGE40820.1 hypothetical protein SACT1_1455 [Streptomyces sp. ACT-1]MYR48890.1 hypothetical protein [Streptomyces sp. SID4928]